AGQRGTMSLAGARGLSIVVAIPGEDGVRPARPSAGEWTLAFLLVLVAAKVALLTLRAADGGGRSWVRPLAAIAFLHDDLRLAALFALLAGALVALERRWPGSRRALAVAYGALTFWTAFNIPVARQLSSPMTHAFLHAAGGALGDSIASYATPVNLGVPAALWLGGLALPGLLRGRLRPSRPALLA